MRREVILTTKHQLQRAEREQEQQSRQVPHASRRSDFTQRRSAVRVPDPDPGERSRSLDYSADLCLLYTLREKEGSDWGEILLCFSVVTLSYTIPTFLDFILLVDFFIAYDKITVTLTACSSLLQYLFVYLSLYLSVFAQHVDYRYMTEKGF